LFIEEEAREDKRSSNIATILQIQVYSTHRQILAIFYERVYLVGGGPGKLKNSFLKILGRESMRWQSFVHAGLG
jgi:hypothetical protein